MAKRISDLTPITVEQLNDDDRLELAKIDPLSPTGFDSGSVSINELRKKIASGSDGFRVAVSLDTTINNKESSFQISVPKAYIQWDEDITDKHIVNMLAKFNMTGKVEVPGTFNGFIFADPTVALHSSIYQRYTKYRSGYLMGTVQDNQILDLGVPPAVPPTQDVCSVYLQNVAENDDYMIFTFRLLYNGTVSVLSVPLRIVLNGYVDISAQYEDAPSYLSLRTVPNGSLAIKGFDVGTVIDWGDGFTTNVTDTTQVYTHFYNNNEYVAKVVPYSMLSPTGENFLVSGEFSEIVDWGSYGFSRQISFSSPDLISVPNVEPPTTSYEYLFNGCENFNQNINGWNTSAVTNMSGMFNSCLAFNQPLNNWNVSNVVDFSQMFNSCLAFNQPLNNWNTSTVTNMSGMFNSCVQFNQSLNSWNTSNVETVGSMFTGCTNFNQPLNDWDTGNVVNMLGIFAGCLNFNQPLDNWNVINVLNMDSMFSSALSFDQDLSGWCVPSILTEPSFFSIDSPLQEQHKPIWGTCSGDDSLKFRSNGGLIGFGGFPVGSLIEMANGTSEIVSSSTEALYISPEEGVNRIYLANSNPYEEFPFIVGFGLEEILDWGNFAGTSIAFVRMGENNSASLVKVPNYIPPTITNMRYMFANTSSFNQDISMWDVSNVTNMDGMFNTALNFDQDLSSWCVPLITSEPADFSIDSPLQEQHKPIWGTCHATENLLRFTANGSLADYNQPLIIKNLPIGSTVYWGVGEPVVVSSFGSISSVYPTDDVDYHGYIIFADDMNGEDEWFSMSGKVLKSIDSWPSARDIRWLRNIGGAVGFELPNTPPNGLDNLTLAFNVGMLSQNFNSANIATWDVSNVTNMVAAFSGCSSFNQDLSGWCVENIPSEPSNFADDTASWILPKPNWGAPCA